MPTPARGILAEWIVAFPGVQILDVTGPHEVFALANRVRRLRPAPLCPVDRGAHDGSASDVGWALDRDAGLLDGRRATTHWRSLPWMRESFPAVTVEEKLHVVEDGHVLTSAGISAGIDMALRVVARYHGEAIADATARHMEYRYHPQDNGRRV